MRALVLLFIFNLGNLYAQDSLNYFVQNALKKYQSGQIKEYESNIAAADKIRPNHPTLVYHLAKSNALMKNYEKTFDASRSLLLMNGNLEFLSDSVFVDFLKSKYLNELNKLKNNINQVVSSSSTYKTVDVKSLHPEAITIINDDLYLGGVHGRELLKVSKTGEKEPILSASKRDDVYAVMGVDYDQKNDLIWVCTAAMQEMKDYNDSLKGKSTVIALTREGKVVKSVSIDGGHFFGDLIVGSDGKVYISDAQANIVYTSSSDSDLVESYDLSDYIYNLQGLALNKDETKLYFSCYIKGLYVLDLKSGDVKPIKLEGDIISKGIDGLYFYNNTLIGIQNGTTPNRVWQLTLGVDDRITNYQIIDQARDVFGEPTQGVIYKGDFIYLANSPWPYYEDGKLLMDEVPETVLLQYNLH